MGEVVNPHYICCNVEKSKYRGRCLNLRVSQGLNNLHNVQNIQYPVKPAGPMQGDLSGSTNTEWNLCRAESQSLQSTRRCAGCRCTNQSEVTGWSWRRAGATLIRLQSGKAGLGRNSAFNLQRSCWGGAEKTDRGDVKAKDGL